MFPKIYPHLQHLLYLDQTAKGSFPGGAPTGITIHYTADRDIERTARALVKEGLGYHLMIGRSGEVTQMISLDKRCYHAGNAIWAGQSPNQHHLAIAIASWGYLEQVKPGVYQSWAKTNVPKADVAMRPDNIKGITQPWDTATTYQIETLYNVLRFFMQAGIKASNICGHDECAIPAGRKSDPGGVLPTDMNQLRKALTNGQPLV